MRKVRVFDLIKECTPHGINKTKVPRPRIALFHQFGCDYDDLEGGPGNYSIAIVEWPDGTVEGVNVNMIQFLD